MAPDSPNPTRREVNLLLQISSRRSAQLLQHLPQLAPPGTDYRTCITLLHHLHTQAQRASQSLDTFTLTPPVTPPPLRDPRLLNLLALRDLLPIHDLPQFANLISQAQGRPDLTCPLPTDALTRLLAETRSSLAALFTPNPASLPSASPPADALLAELLRRLDTQVPEFTALLALTAGDDSVHPTALVARSLARAALLNLSTFARVAPHSVTELSQVYAALTQLAESRDPFTCTPTDLSRSERRPPRLLDALAALPLTPDERQRWSNLRDTLLVPDRRSAVRLRVAAGTLELRRQVNARLGQGNAERQEQGEEHTPPDPARPWAAIPSTLNIAGPATPLPPFSFPTLLFLPPVTLEAPQPGASHPPITDEAAPQEDHDLTRAHPAADVTLIVPLSESEISGPTERPTVQDVHPQAADLLSLPAHSAVMFGGAEPHEGPHEPNHLSAVAVPDVPAHPALPPDLSVQAQGDEHPSLIPGAHATPDTMTQEQLTAPSPEERKADDRSQPDPAISTHQPPVSPVVLRGPAITHLPVTPDVGADPERKAQPPTASTAGADLLRASEEAAASPLTVMAPDLAADPDGAASPPPSTSDVMALTAQTAAPQEGPDLYQQVAASARAHHPDIKANADATLTSAEERLDVAPLPEAEEQSGHPAMRTVIAGRLSLLAGVLDRVRIEERQTAQSSTAEHLDARLASAQSLLAEVDALLVWEGERLEPHLTPEEITAFTRADVRAFELEQSIRAMQAQL